MEDLFIEKSMLDRSTESSEFDRLAGEVMKSTGSIYGQQDLGRRSWLRTCSQR